MMAGQRKENPRRLAVEILNRVEETGAYAEPLLDDALTRKGLANIRDRRLLTQLVYGSLRLRGRCDWLIGWLCKKDEKTLDRVIRNILRVSLYQLLCMDRIPGYAVIDEAVEMTKAMHRAGAGLVNAVLRRFLREGGNTVYPDPEKDPAGYLSVYHSHPLWMVEMWIGMLGLEETAGLCRADNEIPPLTIRVNRLKSGRDALARKLSGEGCATRPTAFSPDGLHLSDIPGPVRELRAFTEGRFVVQDEASQLISFLAAPKRGENVLDVCSGSGIKTTHLAGLMQNEGKILALDINPKKLAGLRKLSGRLGIANVQTVECDAAAETPEDCRQAFDAVLVDAPCSGLGTLRRNPEIKWRLTPEEMKKFPPLQHSILANAAECVKRGGTLVYSTCTISTAENEGVVRSFLAGRSDFVKEEPPAGIDAGLVDSEEFFRTWPHRQGMDGFFGAVFKRQ